jgi:uncharacterized protein (DUF302 family)
MDAIETTLDMTLQDAEAAVRRELSQQGFGVLLLPCNVVLEDLGGGQTRVAIADPRRLLGVFAGSEDEELGNLGSQAAAALERVAAGLAA